MLKNRDSTFTYKNIDPNRYQNVELRLHIMM